MERVNEYLESLACRWRFRVLWFALLVLPLTIPLLTGKAYFEASILYRTPMFAEAGTCPVQNIDLFDPTLILYPNCEITRQALSQGSLPWWKPYNLGGSPLIANGLIGFFYPPRLLFIWLFSTTTAAGLMFIGHFFAAGVLMSSLGRRIGLSGLASLFLGTTWMLGGFVTSMAELGDSLHPAAWVPGLLILTDQCRKGWRPAAWLAVATGGFMLSGHTQYIMNGLLTVLFFGLAMMWQHRCGFGVLRAAVGAVLGLCLALPIYLPMAVHMLESARPILSAAFTKTVHQQFLSTVLPTFVWPELGGSPVTNFYFHRVPFGTYAFWDTMVYAGSATVVLALVGMTRPGLPRLAAVLALAVLILPATSVYSYFQVLPGLNRIYTTRFLALFHFGLVICAAFGFDDIQRFRRRAAGILAVGIGACGIAVMNFYLKAGMFLINNGLAQGGIRMPEPEGSRPEYAQKVLEAFHATYHWSNPSFVVPTVGLGLAAVLLLTRKPIWLLLFATALELLFFTFRWNPTVDKHLLYPRTSAIEFLEQHAGIDRVFTQGGYFPNTLTPYKIHSVCGYDSGFFPRASADYLAALIPSDSRNYYFPHSVWTVGPNYDPDLLNLMGVRYIVVPKEDSLKGLPLVHESSVRIYENPHRMPRTFLLTEPPAIEILGHNPITPKDAAKLPSSIRGQAEIVHYGYNKVVIRTNCKQAGWLVLTDAFAPGWAATVDGESLAVSRVLTMFRAVPVPAGEHEVVFGYEPPLIRPGLVVALLAMLVIAGIAFTSAGATPRALSEEAEKGP